MRETAKNERRRTLSAAATSEYHPNEAANSAPEPNEQGATGNGADIPPPDAPGNLGKYARFIATEVIVAAAREQTHVCLWGSPPKTSYVRAHPDPKFRLDLHVVVHESGGNKKAYLLDPALCSDPDLEGLTKIVQVVPFMTHHQPPKIGLWPISIEHESNPWVRCALNIAVQLSTRWLKVIPVKLRGEYITKDPPFQLHEPDWDRVPKTVGEWLDLAFQESDWLTPDNWFDHPVRKAIREGS